MNEVRRPFYSEYAWAFDLIIDRPVRKECAAIAAWLVDRGALPGAEILDAGCGTGRYAIELARRGYVVRGIDLSPDLIDVAVEATGDVSRGVTFAVGDIAHLPPSRFAAILCRGVLNDIVDDAGRDAVFGAFGRALQPGGVLILDVREWAASVERKAREPLFRKRVSTERGELTFTSFTTLEHDSRQLLISERHELVTRGKERVSDYNFVMRCWEKDEIHTLLARHHFGEISCFGAYDPGVPAGATDRLVVVAQRPGGRRLCVADPSEVVRTFFEAYARATSLVDAGLLASAYAEQFMFAGPSGVQAVRREDFLKVVPKRKAFLTGLGLQGSELRRLEETVLDGQYVQVKAYWAFMFEKEPGRRIVDEGAATYILRREGERLQIVFQLDHQDLTKRAQELGPLAG